MVLCSSIDELNAKIEEYEQQHKVKFVRQTRTKGFGSYGKNYFCLVYVSTSVDISRIHQHVH